MDDIHQCRAQTPGWHARESLADELRREVMGFTDEAAQVTWANWDAVLGMFRSTVRLLVRTEEDKRLKVQPPADESPVKGNPNCVRCSGGPPQFCACLELCRFPGCQWANDAQSQSPPRR